MRDTESVFSRMYNNRYRRHGQLLQKTYGWAVKRNDKSIRTCIAYINNNPLEKQVCTKAIDYFWNPLRMLNSRYSLPPMNSIGPRIRNILKEIDLLCSRNEHLSYKLVNSFLKTKSKSTRNLIINYIIYKYCFIDEELLLSFYKGFHEMVESFDYNTGSEYDIHEDHEHDDYKEYYAAIKQLQSEIDLYSIFNLTGEQKISLYNLLLRETNANRVQIERLLHL